MSPSMGAGQIDLKRAAVSPERVATPAVAFNDQRRIEAGAAYPDAEPSRAREQFDGPHASPPKKLSRMSIQADSLLASFLNASYSRSACAMARSFK
jgi:hypothetical protein